MKNKEDKLFQYKLYKTKDKIQDSVKSQTITDNMIINLYYPGLKSCSRDCRFIIEHLLAPNQKKKSNSNNINLQLFIINLQTITRQYIYNNSTKKKQ